MPGEAIVLTAGAASGLPALLALAPEAAQALVVAALFVVVLARPRQQVDLCWLPWAGAAVSAVSVLALGLRGEFFDGAYQADGLAQFFKLTVALTICVAQANAAGRPLLETARRTEYFLLMNLSALGFMLVAGCVEMATLFVALELGSYSLFALVPLRAGDRRAAEAGIKYILFGAGATALSLFGYSYLLAAGGTGTLAELPRLMHTPAALFGLGLMLCGFLYKLALFPFHAWAPDVYTGTDNETAAYAASAPKLAAAAVLIRLAAAAAPGQDLGTLFAGLAVCSMFVGNLAALAQNDLKRMLGYSAVAHAGYMAMGLAAPTSEGLAAVAFYVAGYALTTLAAFWVLCRLSADGRNLTYSDLSGLSARSPGLAFTLGVAAFSLVGLPPTAGFMGKLFLLSAAWGAGYEWLVVAAVVNTAVSLYFYLNMVRHAYTVDPEGDPAAQPAVRGVPAGLVLAGAVLALGLLPGWVFSLASAAGRQLTP